MPNPGQEGQIAQLVVDNFGADTLASVQLFHPVTRTLGAPISATSTDGRHTWQATIPAYPVGGVWWHKWTVTGAGAGVKFLPVGVGGLQPPAARRAYATSTDLADHLLDVPPDDADLLLAKATVILDHKVLLCAVYPVDDDGLPTQANHIQALRDATCELVNQGLETGDPWGYLASLSSASAGSISIGRAGGAKQGPAAQVFIGDVVLAYLSGAGLLHHSPYQY